MIKRMVEVDKVIRCGRLGLIFNRASTAQESVERRANEMGLQLLGCVPEDATVTEYDVEGTPILGLPDDSPGIVAVKQLLETVLDGGAAASG
jgi:CO dehydrogenase maturation factor